MTGTVTVVETSSNALSRVSFTWTATAGGAASGTSRFNHTGNIVAVCTVPSTVTAPSVDYDITLTDDASVDIGNGQLINRHTSNTEWVFASLGSVVRDKITMTVANAGNAGKGVCHVFIGKGDQAATSDDIRAALYGAAGIAAFPNAAAPANDVSLAEVLRSVWAGLMGTAAGENGITTWPAAAAPGNAVSLAEGLRYVVETQLPAITAQTVRASTVKTPASIVTGNLFTIAGGPVRVLSVVGQITTALEAKANALKLVHTPTGGAGVDLCATVESNAAAIRKCFVLNGVKATALQITTDIGVVTLANQSGMPIVLTPGVISLNGADTATGVVSWHVEYEPLASGATVVAA